jgi:hypothetical protein
MNNFVIPLLASAAFGWSYFRILKGTGIPVGSLLGAGTAAFVMFYPVPGKVVTAILLIAAVGVEIDFQRRKRTFEGIVMQYEGGGIRRGLSPVKVGSLFNLNSSDLFLVGLTQLCQKELVSYSIAGKEIIVHLSNSVRLANEILNPAEKKRARKLSAQQAGKLLTSDEDILLQLIEQYEGQPVQSIPTQVWIDQLKSQALEVLEGYKLEKTVEYYDAYITHRLNGVAVGHFDANDYIDWMALAFVLNELKTAPLIELVKQTRPVWVGPDEDLYNWLVGLKGALVQPD